MSLSNPRTIFGVHSFTSFKRSDLSPIGYARVLQNSTFSLTGDVIELFGGSNKYAWAIEDGDVTAELGFSMSEYPNWIFELFGAGEVTQRAPEAAGNVSDLSAVLGTSIIAATGLLATVTVTDASKLKFSKMLVKATAADAIKVYAYSDVDFGRGGSAQFINDDLEIASFEGIEALDVLAIADFGISLTVGASAPAMVVGDTASFDVRPINTFSREIKVGGIASENPEFSAIIAAQKSSAGAVLKITVDRLKASGLSLGAERKAFGQNDYTAKAAYDSVKDRICLIEEIQ